MSLRSIDPPTGQPLRSLEHDTGEQLEAKTASAQAAYPAWKARTLADRAEVRYGAGVLAYCARKAEAWLAPTRLHPRHGGAHMEYDAPGPILCIEPRNFPYYLFVNNLDWADSDLPFGGIRNSGFGRELGRPGMRAFVNAKRVRTGHLPAPARPPTSPSA